MNSFSMISEVKIFNNKIHALAVIAFLTRIILFSILPFIPFLLNSNPYNINLVIMLFLLGDVFGGVFIGVISDKYIRVNVLKFCLLLLIIILFALMFSYSLISYILLLSALGITMSGINVNVTAISINMCEQKYKKLYFYYRYYINNISSLFGIVMGNIFLNISYKNIIYLICFICSSITFFLYCIYIKDHIETPIVTNNYKIKHLNAWGYKIIPFIGINIILLMTHQQLTTNVPIFLKTLYTNANSLYSIGLIINILIVMFSIHKFQKINNFIFILMPIGMIMLQFHNQCLFILAIIIYSVGEMFLFPYISYCSEKYMPKKSKSTAFGILNTSRLGLSLGGIIGNAISNHFGYRNMFWMCGFAQLLSILFLALLQKTK